MNRSYTSFAVFGLYIVLVVLGFRWVTHQPNKDGIPAPLRNTLSFNERFFSNFFSTQRTSKAFKPVEANREARKNGLYGLEDSLDAANWKMIVIHGNNDTLTVTLDYLKKMPKTDVIFDFKCIEGWSQVTHWAGVRFSDFVKYYKLGTKSGNAIADNPSSDWYKYAGLETPNGNYFVGIDMPSMMQPQTILCYEVNGHALPEADGAPLRLIIPVKYGVKHLKRIGKIFFSDAPPRDYWAQSGYDYYAGF